MATEVARGDPISDNNGRDNIEEGQGSRKSKRQKMVPSGLLDDYQCGPHLRSRLRDSQKFIFGLADISETTRKYAILATKLKAKFVFNLGGIAVYPKDIVSIVERPRMFSAKVVDILIRVLRLTIVHQLPTEGAQSSEFFDTKFVSGIIKTFPRFLKSKKKESFVFPKVLSDVFPTKDSQNIHPTRYYFPFNVANKHWVGICFDAARGIVTVLDCNTAKFKDASLDKYLTPIVQMLPYVARFACLPIGADPIIQCYDVARPKSLHQHKNPSDCGLMAVLLMATHALYGIEVCKNINNDILEEEGMCAAILAYEVYEKL
ncbi:unnamed protein product [Brassica rapa subsp. narinosa]